MSFSQSSIGCVPIPEKVFSTGSSAEFRSTFTEKALNFIFQRIMVLSTELTSHRFHHEEMNPCWRTALISNSPFLFFPKQGGLTGRATREDPLKA